MYPKLYWDEKGNERSVHNGEEEDQAIADGLSDLPNQSPFVSVAERKKSDSREDESSQQVDEKH